MVELLGQHLAERRTMASVHEDPRFSNPDAKKAIKTMKSALRATAKTSSFAERESRALEVANEAVRQFLQEELQELAGRFRAGAIVDGVAYVVYTPEPGTISYYSLCGALGVERFVLRQQDVRNGPTIDPVALAAGLVEGATPALAYSIAEGYAEHDMRQHFRTLRSARREPPSRSTLERMATRLGERAHRVASGIQGRLRRGEAPPEGSIGVSLGLDRTSAPMMELRALDAPPKPAPKRTKPRQRRAPLPFDVVFRMAYVGTVSFVDANGNALGVRRYAAPACDDPALLAAQMLRDVRAAVRREPNLVVGVVQDGAPEMWNVMRDALQPLVDEGLIDNWEEGIDRYHLLERLAEATKLTVPREAERTRIFGELISQFDDDDATIDLIETELTERRPWLSESKRDKLDEHLTYIANNKDRMRYATLRQAGLPVGSGVTESAAKTVIGHRAKRSGQRWSESGLRGVLALRAVHLSERLPRFWLSFSRRYAANIEPAAAAA